MPNLTRKRKTEASSVQGKENKLIKETKIASERKPAEKASNKDTILSQLKALQEKHDALLNENKNNLELIDELKQKVATLEKAKFTEKSSKTEDCQTVSDLDCDIEIPCKDCVYNASCEEELRWHMTSEHNWGEPDCESQYSCRICGRKFTTKGELMSHRKEIHTTTIKICRYFVQGKCAFNDDVCWYSHNKIEQNKASEFPQTLKEFTCSFCDNKFKRKTEFMEHRKSMHADHISECRDNKNGWCRFSDEDCWYNHRETSFYKDFENATNKNPEMIEKLFNMMEKYAERIEALEIQM